MSAMGTVVLQNCLDSEKVVPDLWSETCLAATHVADQFICFEVEDVQQHISPIIMRVQDVSKHETHKKHMTSRQRESCACLFHIWLLIDLDNRGDIFLQNTGPFLNYGALQCRSHHIHCYVENGARGSCTS
jgi:hypothetical protein